MKADGPCNATLLALCSEPPSERVRSSIGASAPRLGHQVAPAFACTALASPQELRLLVFELDPWAVVALDDEAAGLLRAAFGDEAQGLEADTPVEACGYTLVAVPGFGSCFDTPELKRLAWTRLGAVRHPAPL